MEYFIVFFAALAASGLTLFSGFGLGTLLMPVFVLFFPIEAAIAVTAVVHFLNNLFKLALLGKHADKDVVLKFGLPAILAAFAGAGLLLMLTDLKPLFSYQLGDDVFFVSPVKLVISLLMFVFAIYELLPVRNMSFDRKYLPLGGLLSGFFGGLSGHQGALRSAFLLKCNLTKEAFIASGVVIACLIDTSRLFIYSSRFSMPLTGENIALLSIATLSAFAGAYLGNKLLKKVTMKLVRVLVSIMLFMIALGLGMGII